MKKLLSICVIGMIVLFGLGAVVQGAKQTQKSSCINDQTGITYIDELDQAMTFYEGYIPIGAMPINQTLHVNLTVAQSFLPQKEVITRVQFLMTKNASASIPCSLFLRENLTGQNLASVQVNPTQFTVLDPDNPQSSFNWVTFDLPDT